MHVIGAGFGRTGTSSLMEALTLLKLGLVYHMSTESKHATHPKLWIEAAANRPVDWHKLLAGYHCAIDWPAATFYKELMVAYPDAKVILTVRDFEGWYKSARNTIYEIQEFPIKTAGRFLPRLGPIIEMADVVVWKRT